MHKAFFFLIALFSRLGDVVDVKIAVGDSVEKGQVVAVLSAMKMEMAVQVRAYTNIYQWPASIAHINCASSRLRLKARSRLFMSSRVTRLTEMISSLKLSRQKMRMIAQ